MKNISLNGLAFHGIGLDKMEKSSISEEMRRNFLEHMIIRLLRREWGVVHRGTFKTICRFYFNIESHSKIFSLAGKFF